MLKTDKNVHYRSTDMPMFVGTDAGKLEVPELVGDEKIMGDMKGTRIPAILNAKIKEDKTVLIAMADIGNEGADWGNLNLGMRRSYDGGQTWTNVEKVISFQAHHAPQKDEDWYSPFEIDPVLFQGLDGTIHAVVDMYAESKGLCTTPSLEYGSGYEKVDGEWCLVLFDGKSKLAGNDDAEPGNKYYLKQDGWVYHQNGKRTNYYVPKKHSSEYQYQTIGDMYFAMGEPDYLTEEPPLIPDMPTGNQDIYVGNIFMSVDKPEFQEDHPTFVVKRKSGPDSEFYSDYRVIETDPAPLRTAVTQFLWITSSIDGGITWTQPEDITMQVKWDADEAFLGTGPGVGLVLQRQKEEAKNGRFIVPLYNITHTEERATIIYSDDNGKTWSRPNGDGLMNNQDEVQCIELFDGTVMSFGRQMDVGDTPVSYSEDGGETWSSKTTTQLPSLRCQKSVITYPIDNGTETSPYSYPQGMTPGKQYVISSHPTGDAACEETRRTDPTISIGEVLADHQIDWIRHKKIVNGDYDMAGKEYLQKFCAYSCLCVLDNGNLGLLYEPQPNNYIAYAEISLSWILAES